jgi:hypothetical protein
MTHSIRPLLADLNCEDSCSRDGWKAHRAFFKAAGTDPVLVSTLREGLGQILMDTQYFVCLPDLEVWDPKTRVVHPDLMF